MQGRERVFRTEAVILRRHDLGEADRLLSVFTPDRGKLRVVAKGVRRTRSRKAGHLEPLTRTSLLIARGRDLDIVTQAEAIETFPGLRSNLLQVGHASYAVELVDRFTWEEGEGHSLYHLLVDTLSRLEGGRDPFAVLRFFELHLLETVGYRPELYRCLGCSAEIQAQDQFFGPVLGGVLCPACGPRQPGTRALSLSALKVLRHLQRSAFEAAAAPAIRTGVRAEVERLLEEYIAAILERRLHTPAFLRTVRRLEPDPTG
ncbi:MAG TPA: DNA repair protein RecO [Anaerolineales bacterium]|nr:DNA repair protein RecO [Anaerolineales bacterium]